MRGTRVVWSAIVLMSALSSAGAAQSAGGDGARFAQSPQYPLLPRALEIELALSAAPSTCATTRRSGSSTRAVTRSRGRAATPSRAWSAAAPAICSRCAGTRKGRALAAAARFRRRAAAAVGEVGPRRSTRWSTQRFKTGTVSRRPRGPASRTCCRRCGTASTSTAVSRAPHRTRT